MRRLSPLSRKIALSAASVVIVLLLCEALLRRVDPFGISYHLAVNDFLDRETGAVEVAEPPMKYVLRPGYHFEGPFEARINALRMRGPAAVREKPDDAFRVLFLGDSVTFGLGVDDEECFADLLRQELSLDDGRRLEILNAGCPGYTAVDEYLFLERYARGLRPDLVVVFFVPDDLPRDYSDREKVTQDASSKSVLRRFFDSPVLHEVYLKQLLKHAYWVRLQSQGRLEAAYGIGSAGHTDEARRGYLVIVDELHKLVRGEGARLVMASFGEEEFLRESCAERDLAYFSCLSGPEEFPVELRLSAVDAHPNPNGHRLFADRIKAAWLDQDLDLIPGLTVKQAD